MNTLVDEKYELARSFLKQNARGLERALFEFYFEDGSRESVLQELNRYQNPDGGFGNGLEPDFTCTASSALATAIGLETLLQVGFDGNEVAVQRAVHYLLQTFNKEKMGWQIVPVEVNDAPRAIWWNYSEEWDWGNPTAHIVGLLHQVKELVPIEFLEDITQYAIQYINGLEETDHHELICFVKFAELVPSEVFDQVEAKLQELLKITVNQNPDDWNSYCLTPLQVVQSPDSPFHSILRESIQANVVHLLHNQAEEGTWNPPWDWMQFEKEGKIAKEQWKGCLTVNALRILRAFGYIESH